MNEFQYKAKSGEILGSDSVISKIGDVSDKRACAGSISVSEAITEIRTKAKSSERYGDFADFEQDALDFERLCRKHGFIESNDLHGSRGK